MKNKHNIFKKGLENKDYFENKYNITKASNLKYCLWLISVIVLSRKSKLNSNKIKIIYSELQYKILSKDKVYRTIFTGKYLNSISEINKNITFVSHFNYYKRIKILFKSIYESIKNKIDINKIAMWIEYCYLYELIISNNLDEIFIAGHFDRYATWISYLCKELNITFKITQHGAIDYIDLPNKMYCNEFYVFNKYEASVVKNIISSDHECKIIEKGFRSSINFESIEKENKSKVSIAIASQDALTDLTLELIENIQYKFKDYNFDLIIYPHYREHDSKYKELITKYNNIYVEKSKRYANIDLLITFYSTIVYDYLDFDIKIMCLSPQNINMSFFNHEKVNLYRDKEELYEGIKQVIQN